MSFCLRPNVCKKCGKPLTMFEGWVCLECEKAEQEPSDTVSCGVFEQVMRERDIAIEQLHELGYELGQKIEPCDEVISRQAAIDAFERFIHELGIEDEPYNYGEMALSVRNVPPVTPQQKTGHWIHFAQSDDCSECGWSTGKYISPSKFCPNCGSAMKGE